MMSFLSRKQILLLLVITFVLASAQTEDYKTLASATFTEYVQYYKFPIEQHTITTQDGYILTFYRIQQKGTKIVPGKPVVYLQHGLLDSSFCFVENTELKAPGFILANLGFDVWLGNSRGNHMSLGHKTLNWQNDPEYWSFSWQEMSQYDLPAAFQYIANYTNAKKIDYIGHSQGTSIMFAALAEKDPVVNKYLGKFIALGPVAYVNNADASLVGLVKKENLISVLKFFKLNHVLMKNNTVSRFQQIVCNYFPDFCGIFNKGLANQQPETDDLQRFNVILGHYPDSTSVKTLEHWQQMLKNTKIGVMQKFDYGALGNMKLYGTSQPPAYDLSNITHKVHLIAGQYDRIADPTDVKILQSKLPNSELHFINGGHGTFGWAKDVSYFYELVTPVLLNKK